MKQNNAVDISTIAARAEFVLDELIELIEVEVGEKLTCQVANGQSLAGQRMKQALMARNLGK